MELATPQSVLKHDEFATVLENSLPDLILPEVYLQEVIGNVQHRAGVMVDGEWLAENIQQRLNLIASVVLYAE